MLKKLICTMLTLVLLVSTTTAVSATTITTSSETDLLDSPAIKTGTTKVKIKAGEGTGSRAVAFTAPKNGTYTFKISNVKVKGVDHGDIWFSPDSGKYTSMFFKYKDKEVSIVGHKTTKVRAISKSYYKSLPDKSDKSVFAETAKNNIAEVEMYYNPTFKVKLNKDEVFLLTVYYIHDHDVQKDVNGKIVGNEASYTVKIKGDK